MQKKIIALAIAAAFAAPVAAQAEVSMYGSMDGGLRQQKNTTDAVGTTASFAMGQWNTARFGFKGTDDLGDGMKAVVVLETSLAPGDVGSNSTLTSGNRLKTSDNSASTTTEYNTNNPFGLLFDREATVGLEGGMGKFAMGWQTALAYNTATSLDPMQGKLFLLTAVNSMTASGASRTGSMLASTKVGDVKVSFEHQVANANRNALPQQGFGNAVGVSYAVGDISAAASYTAVQATPYVADGYDDSKTHLIVGGGYKMGDIKLNAGYVSKTSKTATSTATASNANATDVTLFAGASFAMSSKVSLMGAYYSQTTNAGGATTTDNATSKRAVVAATYALSKATTAYAEVDRIATVSAAAVEGVANGMGFGLNTSF
jgi:predicted porin